MSKKTLLISLILTALGLILQWAISGIGGFFGVIFDILFLSALLALLTSLIRMSRAGFRSFFLRNILICGSILGVLSGLVVLFAIIMNSFPASLSEIHLSDGKRSIVFMQMSHIGTDTYYTSVNERLQSLAASGYTLYREWVGPGSQESVEQFDRALGIKMTPDTYKSFADLIGLTAQDDRLYAGIGSGSIRLVDLTLDQIVGLMNTGSISSDPPVDIGADIRSLSWAERWPLLGYIIRGILNMSLRSLPDTDIILSALDPSLSDAILKARNTHVVETLLADPRQNIVIVYGALHFEWIFDLLRSSQPAWKIVRVEPYYPYKK